MVWDIFSQDAFSLVSMTNAIDKVPYVPQTLGMMNVFRSNPVATETVWVDRREGLLTLIPTSPRGAPPASYTPTRATAYNFNTVRLAKQSTVTANQVQNIRAFGTESRMQAVQELVGRQMVELRRDMELTHEFHRLGAVNGIVLDSDGVTELVNWYTVFGITPPTEIDFDLDNAAPVAGALRDQCRTVRRAMVRASGGLMSEMTPIVAVCGDAFWDDLTNHVEVRDIYSQWEARIDMLTRGDVFQTFRFGDIEWMNYRSTDDGGASPQVGVPTDKCRFFPRSPDVFEVAWSPGEALSQVNTPGRPIYAEQNVDPSHSEPRYVNIEVSSYPLFICRRPEVLQQGRRT